MCTALSRVQCGTLDSFELTQLTAITNGFVGALQHHASASQRASGKASQRKSLWHYGLQFV
jgi:hypothetical protein